MSTICFLYRGQRSKLAVCFLTGDFFLNNGGQGTTVAESSVGQAVSNCQQGYHVSGGITALVALERERETTAV